MATTKSTTVKEAEKAADHLEKAGVAAEAESQSLLNSASAKASELAANGKAKVSEWSDQAKDVVNDCCDSTATYVRTKPLTSLLIAAGVGAVVALATRGIASRPQS